MISVHDAAVMALAARLNLETSGFRRAVRERLCRPHGPMPWDELSAVMKFLPDAFAIDSEAGTVDCYEVIDTSRLTVDRRIVYGFAWMVLDYYDARLRVWTCDVYGSVPLEQSACDWYWMHVLLRDAA